MPITRDEYLFLLQLITICIEVNPLLFQYVSQPHQTAEMLSIVLRRQPCSFCYANPLKI